MVAQIVQRFNKNGAIAHLQDDFRAGKVSRGGDWGIRGLNSDQ